MSRKYCDICGVAHRNGGLGRCDDHLETLTPSERQAAIVAENRAMEWGIFESCNTDERWRLIFDFLYDQGFRT